MSDVLITKRRDRAFVSGMTKKGRAWINENVENVDLIYEIPADVAEELARDMTGAGLEVHINDGR